jgi:hypothetical protein
MAKRKTDQDPAADAAPSAVTLRYVGPEGHMSPVFGELVPDRTYTTADASFAAYLAEKHPEYWQLAAKE